MSLRLVGRRQSGYRAKFVTVSDTGRTSTLERTFRDLPAHDLSRLDPVRRFASYKKQQHFPNFWWCTFTGRLVACESWLERDCAMLIDYRGDACELIGQPFELSWDNPSKRCGYEVHTPDFMVQYDDGSVKVVDCKSMAGMKDDAVAKFERTADACEQIGWSYEVLHELDLTLMLNILWLSGYRRPLHPKLCQLVDPILDMCSTPMTVADVEGRAPTREDRLLMRPVLFHLMWHHLIEPEAPLAERPFSERTVVTTVDEGQAN